MNVPIHSTRFGPNLAPSGAIGREQLARGEPGPQIGALEMTQVRSAQHISRIYRAYSREADSAVRREREDQYLPGPGGSQEAAICGSPTLRQEGATRRSDTTDSSVMVHSPRRRGIRSICDVQSWNIQITSVR